MSDTNFVIPTDFANCFFVLHTAKDKDGYADSLFVRPLVGFCRKDNTNGLFDLYGIRASSYGTKVPPTAAGWALVHNNDGTLTTLASADIPEPVTKQTVELSDGRLVTIRRSQSNIFFAVSAQPSVLHNILLV